MVKKETGKTLEYIFRAERGKPDPLTFLYVRPTAEMVARYKNAIISGTYSQNGDDKSHVQTAVNNGTAKLGLLAECVRGWTGYCDDRGKPIKYSREELFEFDGGMLDEFMDEVDRLIYPKPAEVKNSVRPSEPGSSEGRSEQSREPSGS